VENIGVIMSAKLFIDGVEVMTVEQSGDMISVSFAGGAGCLAGEGYGKAPIAAMLNAGQFGKCLVSGDVRCSKAEYDDLKRLAYCGDASAKSLLDRVTVVDLA